MNIIEKIFGTHSENELKRIYPIVDKIEALGPEMEALSDEELRGKTREFKERLKEGETLDDILPENNTDSVVDVGLVEIPSERIIGTKSAGRISAFTASFSAFVYLFLVRM